MTRPRVLSILALIVACDRTPSRREPFAVADRAPLDAQRPGWETAPARAATPAAASVVRGDCITAGPIMLRGIVRQEVRWGAPGYGEDTLADRRDTIAVLVLPKTLALCPDSTLHAAGEPPVRFDRVTLRYVPREILQLQGLETAVFGRLDEATFGFEQGPVLLRVDSVPALRRLPKARAT